MVRDPTHVLDAVPSAPGVAGGRGHNRSGRRDEDDPVLALFVPSSFPARRQRCGPVLSQGADSK